MGCMVVVSLEEKKGSSTDRGTEAHMYCPWQEKVLALASESFWGRRWVLCKANAPVMIPGLCGCAWWEQVIGGVLLLCPKLLYKIYLYPAKTGSWNEKYIFLFSLE